MEWHKLNNSHSLNDNTIYNNNHEQFTSYVPNLYKYIIFCMFKVLCKMQRISKLFAFSAVLYGHCEMTLPKQLNFTQTFVLYSYVKTSSCHFSSVLMALKVRTACQCLLWSEFLEKQIVLNCIKNEWFINECCKTCLFACCIFPSVSLLRDFDCGILSKLFRILP